jgi:multicomponent Na+:H+ antiporter subunit C
VSVLLVVLVGVLFATGTFLMLHRTATRIVLGVGLLGNGVNLLLLVAGGEPGAAPLVGAEEPTADPLPQAFMLTAIVIGFALLSFLLALAWRSWTIDGNDEVEDDIEDRRLAGDVPADHEAAPGTAS